MVAIKNAKVVDQLDTIHSKLFMVYVMMTQGRAALVDLDMFKATLNDLEGLYSEVVPEW